MRSSPIAYVEETAHEIHWTWNAPGSVDRGAPRDYRVSHAHLRSPDFLTEPEALVDALRFQRPVKREDSRKVVNATWDPGAAHIWK